jgi:hypothetical protein
MQQARTLFGRENGLFTTSDMVSLHVTHNIFKLKAAVLSVAYDPDECQESVECISSLQT